jgi:hypothetical protein
VESGHWGWSLWHPHWENGELLVHCDNDAVVDAINKRSIRGPTITPLQTLLLIAALFSITISAVWIPTASNSIADALSRQDFKRLANLGHQDYNHHNVRNSEPQAPVSILRQKLQSFCTNPSLTMKSTSMRPSTRDSQDFHEASSSPGINGILFNLLDSIYPVNTPHSTASTTVETQSPSHSQKRTHPAKERTSISPPHKALRSTQSQPSTISSNDSIRSVPHPYSIVSRNSIISSKS